ncbi:MAG: acyl-ACP--UDP-N-acetylglucosamine O-acyltransferase [Candidatus Alcyoniella australis]|nr:acyl-ACP--UDP-N-acetylglucosamine O-acyltransferase [Candidatus Alcyoniella australis]
MSIKIHPTAVVDSAAQLGKGVVVGPGCVICAGASIGEDCTLVSNVRVEGNTTIGPGALIKHGASLGGDPQTIDYGGWPTFLEIGPKAWIGEYVTVHRGSKEGAATRLGSEVYMMAYSHVGHDCQVGDCVIMTNYAGLAGHVTVEQRAIIAAYGGVHQFCRIGTYAMLGAHSGVGKDVTPYTIVQGVPAVPRSLNIVGLQRAGFSEQTLAQLKKLYKLFFRSSLDTSQAVQRARLDLEPTEQVEHFIAFVEASERGICK